MTPHPTRDGFWPKLSETLPYPKDPLSCQSCGLTAFDARTLQRWIECDEYDQPTRTTVVLCPTCAERLIEPHPRLYHQLEKNAPRPGCMDLCLRCTNRQGTDCTHPDLKANGGYGLPIRVKPPTRAHVRGTKFSGFITIWDEPPDECSGQQLEGTPA